MAEMERETDLRSFTHSKRDKEAIKFDKQTLIKFGGKNFVDEVTQILEEGELNVGGFSLILWLVKDIINNLLPHTFQRKNDSKIS